MTVSMPQRISAAVVTVLCTAGFAASSTFAASSPKGGAALPVVAKSGKCGTLPYVAPDDPKGVLRKLDKTHQAAYVGFTDYPIVKSPWANWKPKRKSGFNVQIVWVPPTNPFVVNALKGLQASLKASGKVKTMQIQVPSGPMDISGQLQQMQTAISRKPDLIIVYPLAGPALVPLVDKAGQAGIPTVYPASGVSSKYAVGVFANLYLSRGLGAAGVLKIMGGKGSVLQVRGVPAVPNDQVAAGAWKKALSRCPNVTVAGTVQGNYDNTNAKAVVQQFLATHPSGVQGVFQSAVMGQGVLGAFTQAGKTPPPLNDQATSEGAIAYWHNHPKYKMVAMALPAGETGTVTAKIALRMLNGDGVKLNMLLDHPYLTLQASTLWKPSFKENGLAPVSPPRGSFMKPSYFDGFFAHKGKES